MWLGARLERTVTAPRRRRTVAPRLQLQIAGCSHVGKVRTTNEDRLVIEPRLGLCAVLDGMGGQLAGDVAAQLAADTVRTVVQQRAGELAPRELLEDALNTASAAVFSQANERRECRGMGTTIVAGLLVEPAHGPAHIVIAHAGDSRAYLLRDGELQQLTRDHTVAEEWIAAGWLRREDADRHYGKHILARNLGMLATAAPDVVELALEPGDRLLLCSDGLHGMASAEAMQRALAAAARPGRIAHALIELALRGGGGDNISAIVIAGGQPPSGAG